MQTLLRGKIVFFVEMVSVIVIAFLSQGARATVITFDDLFYNDEEPGFFSNPVTDQYLSKGLLIDQGYLAQYWPTDSMVSSPNYLLGGTYMTLIFVGDFPTTVSMYISSRLREVISLTAFDTTGKTTLKETQGWAGPLNDTPYRPGQYVSFNEPKGISSIMLTGFFGQRTEAEVDDLTYYLSSEVPEPAPISLLGLGLIYLIRRRITLN
jgi:hypothetical protein